MSEIRKVVFVDSCNESVFQRNEDDWISCSSVLSVSFNTEEMSSTTQQAYVGSMCPGKIPEYTEGGDNSNVYILPPFRATFTFPNGTPEHIELMDTEGYNAKYKRDVKGQTWYLRESPCAVISKKPVLVPDNPSDKLEQASIYIRKELCIDCSEGHTVDALGNIQGVFTIEKEESLEIEGYVRLVDSGEHQYNASHYSLTASSFFLDSGVEIPLEGKDDIRIYDDLTKQRIHTRVVKLDVVCVLPYNVRVWTSSAVAVNPQEPVTGSFRLEDSENWYALPNEVPFYQLTSNNTMDFGHDELGNTTLSGWWFRSKGRVIDNNTDTVYIPFNADMGNDLLKPGTGAVFFKENDLVQGGDIFPLNVVEPSSGSPEVVQVSSKFVDVSVTPNKTYYGYPQSPYSLWGSEQGSYICGQLCEIDTSIDE